MVRSMGVRTASGARVVLLGLVAGALGCETVDVGVAGPPGPGKLEPGTLAPAVDAGRTADDAQRANDIGSGAADIVPGATDIVPGATDIVPGATDIVTGATDIVTGATDIVPVATDIVPGATDIVPVATDIVPVATDIVPVVKDIVTGAADVVPPAPDVAKPAPDTTQPPAVQNGLVVHEWGTFTSVQGSDGKTLDGLHHEEEGLPGFVYGRAKTLKKQKGLEGLPEPCNQKMETPIVYFHTKQAQTVTLKVDFPQGVISQWFPAATAFLPKIDEFETYGDPMPAGKHLAGGMMTWTVLVDPTLAMAQAPAVPATSIWQPARLTTGVPVRYQGPNHEGDAVKETERFLFYRGLGRFTLPVQVFASPGGALTLHNGTPDVIAHAVLLHTTTTGHGGVTTHGALFANTDMKAAVPKPTLAKAAAMQAAKAALKQGLVAAGLFDDEAQAMVDTWQKSWFATPGVRLLYVLPQPWTEKLLPMQVKPAPVQNVRVLVGRIEILTPEDEQAAVAAVQASQKAGNFLALASLDRFQEPRIRRACALLGSPAATWCAKLIPWAEKGQ